MVFPLESVFPLKNAVDPFEKASCLSSRTIKQKRLANREKNPGEQNFCRILRVPTRTKDKRCCVLRLFQASFVRRVGKCALRAFELPSTGTSYITRKKKKAREKYGVAWFRRTAFECLCKMGCCSLSSLYYDFNLLSLLCVTFHKYHIFSLVSLKLCQLR